ncbi:MAG: hypothetical protein M1828_000660 [Chrysothrix sp. TS-e1954]|nr:MAG: hypothetical protein M1828_000660 [Chrysothrix sp. TS-e1954]
MVAAETSKRKFHRLLENLTSTTTNAPQPLQDAHVNGSPAAKRPRIEPKSRLSHNEPPSTTTQSTTTPSHRPTLRQITRASSKNKANTSASTVARKPPNYVPWSHERFLDRLKTFADVRLWTSKPDAINEVQWAKRGWTCDGINRVACKGGCERRVVIALRPRRKDEQGKEIEDSEDFSVEVGDELVERYEALISTGHSETCLWSSSGCKDDIYRMPIARSAIWQPQLRGRYQSFRAASDSIPPLDRIVLPMDLNKTTAHLPSGFFATASAEKKLDDQPTSNNNESRPKSDEGRHDPTDHAALALALTGWHGSISSPGYALATCDACFRRVGLWLYKPTISGSANGKDPSLEAEPLKLDLLSSHRDYCPWVSATSQNAVGAFEGLAAWQILQRVIENAAEFKRTSLESATSADETGAGRGAGDQIDGAALDEPKPKSIEEVEKEDKVRFAKLKELTKSMGLKRLKGRFGRTKPALGDAASKV